MDSKKWTKEEMEEKLKMKIHPAMKFRRNLSLAMILTVSVGGSAPRQGVREGGNRLGTYYERDQLAIPLCAVFGGEVNELVSSLQHLPPGAPRQPGDTCNSPNFETVI